MRRLVLLQRESVVQLNMAKAVSEFPALSEVQQLSTSAASDYCLAERLTLSKQADWDWLDMINTFYHVGEKQVCEF